ncbi:AraC family transcriptional regulator [Photobacterium galatheae]|uniref:AraC family transcriptional regulator n=1 Tax=Photobacterium galatheae TaxID=1654360 RepID=A0A066RVS4_9GAMM|nr:helix-turn-helix transcriptional regulator [Photobacterium galatheae]KDM93161.1 AraC family transcriptional regulator [Photobacterium galatheae]MCM0148310.1 helix-turn-helix transcriptional regulator [Photobacterium galatheae]
MAVIDQKTAFDADKFTASVIGIAADVGQHDSGVHQHRKGQILYAPQGCMTFALEHAICILPPTKAVWIPPQTAHRAVMTNVVAYRSLYFDGTVYDGPEEITMIEVNDLLKALMNRMAFWPWDKPEAEMVKTTALFWEEFYLAKRHDYQLPVPVDARLNLFRTQIMQDTFLAPSASSLAESVGLSPKTVTRIFKADTGMSYQDWRQQWRLLKAIELLSSGMLVADVSVWLEFSSDSAFIAFFKQQTGKTPLRFMERGTTLVT